MAKPISKNMASRLKAEIAYFEGATNHQMTMSLMHAGFQDIDAERPELGIGKHLPTEQEVEANAATYPSYTEVFVAMDQFLEARAEGDEKAVATAERTVKRLMLDIKRKVSGDPKHEQDFKNIESAWLIAQADELVTWQEARAQVQDSGKRARN